MSFRIPDYSDRPVTKNPYVLWGLGFAAASFGLSWWRGRKPDLAKMNLEPPVNPEPGAANVGVETVTYTTAQAESFRNALPERGQIYAPLFIEAGAKEGVPPVLLASLMATESAFGGGCKDAACRGFAGNDYGLMQINSKAHPQFFATTVNGRPAYEDPRASVMYGAKVLRGSIAYIQQKTGLSGTDLLFAGVAGYNAGQGAVVKKINKGQSPDAATYNGNYAKTVFGHAESILKKMNLVVG